MIGRGRLTRGAPESGVTSKVGRPEGHQSVGPDPNSPRKLVQPQAYSARPPLALARGGLKTDWTLRVWPRDASKWDDQQEGQRARGKAGPNTHTEKGWDMAGQTHDAEHAAGRAWWARGGAGRRRGRRTWM